MEIYFIFVFNYVYNIILINETNETTNGQSL